MTEMRHSRIGGSTIDRTMQCPGWLKESEGIPKGPASEYAMEGTALHSCMETIVLEDMARDDIEAAFLGKVIEGVEITQDHIDNRILPAFDAWVELKELYALTDWEPEVHAMFDRELDIGGYSDLIAWNGYGDVFCLDFKFGQGHMVDPTNLPQGKFYTMAARKDSVVADELKHMKKVFIVIIQPNDRNSPTLKIWKTNVQAIDEFEQTVLAAVAEADGPNPSLNPGDHCRWCPAAPLCPAKTGQILKAMHMDHEDLAILGENMDLVSEVKAWIKNVEAAVFRQLEAGAEVPGWKLVQKRSTRHWIDEEETINKLRRKMHGIGNMQNVKLLSPNQMEEKAKELDVEIEIDDMVTSTSSGTTIAPIDDRRPEAPNPKTLAASLASIT